MILKSKLYVTLSSTSHTLSLFSLSNLSQFDVVSQTPTSKKPSITIFGVRKMQDPRTQFQSSPTISSISSSDLDTESTGSFFHDRSITLGTLMGLNFSIPMPFRAASSSSSHRHVSPSLSISTSNSRRQRKRPSSNSADKHRRRKWWRLCRDDDGEDGVGDGIHRRTGDSKRSSLGEYLEVERRFGDDVDIDSAVTELEGAVVGYRDQPSDLAGRALFAADGKVLPPASVSGEDTPVASVLCRFPVYLTGICSGGGGG